jgi:Icc-related predicted phosphoesterase
LNDFDTVTHRGFECFNDLLDRYEPKLFVHGHIHRNYGHGIPQKMQHNNTLVVNASDHCNIEIDV